MERAFKDLWVVPERKGEPDKDGKGSPNSEACSLETGEPRRPKPRRLCVPAMSRLSFAAESRLSGAQGGDGQAGEHLLGRTGSSTPTHLQTPDSVPRAHLLPPQPGHLLRHLFPMQQPLFSGWETGHQAGKKPAWSHLVPNEQGVCPVTLSPSYIISGAKQGKRDLGLWGTWWGKWAHSRRPSTQSSLFLECRGRK